MMHCVRGGGRGVLEGELGRDWGVSGDKCRCMGKFLDAISHLYKRVCLSVRPSVRDTRVEFLRNEISGLIKKKKESIKNIQLIYDSETSSWADGENATVVKKR